MHKAVFGVIAVVVMAVLARILFFGPSDRELVLQALDESVEASRAGQPGGVLEYLSRSLTFNGEPIADRREIADVVRQSKPEITVIRKEPQINGDTATIVSPVQVKLNYGPISLDQTIERVEITFAKEVGTRYGVIPSPKWRVSNVQADVLTDLGFDGGQPTN